MNYFDENDSSEFRDIPEDGDNQDFPVENTHPAQRRTVAVQQAKQIAEQQEEYVQEEEQEEEQEEDYSEVLKDASLRLEQGNLYKIIMKHDLFEGMDADPRAIKNVQREIREFAEERMRIMLGMTQVTDTPTAFPAESFPFNALEVKVLKTMASTFSKGATEDAEAFVPESPKPVAAPQKRLNPISKPQAPKALAPKPVTPTQKTNFHKPLSKAVEPVKRAKIDESAQKILRETGITAEQAELDYRPLSPKDFENPEKLAQRNAELAKRLQKKAINPTAAPMPSQDAINSMYTAQAAIDSYDPKMQSLMGLLLNRK